MTTTANKMLQNNGLKGSLGIIATVATITPSFITGVVPWLQAVSLVTGIMVGIVTVWSIVKSNRRKDALLKIQLKDEETTVV